MTTWRELHNAEKRPPFLTKIMCEINALPDSA
jgi:hypothetical protein